MTEDEVIRTSSEYYCSTANNLPIFFTLASPTTRSGQFQKKPECGYRVGRVEHEVMAELTGWLLYRVWYDNSGNTSKLTQL